MASSSQDFDSQPDNFDTDLAVEQSEARPATGQQHKATERRDGVRRPIHLRVMVAIGKTVVHGRLEDLSITGACLRITVLLSAGARIDVRLLTPLNKQFDHLDVGAMVRYSSMTSGEPPCRIGVQFVDADADLKRKLASLLLS